jgi:hypothetical protein
MLFLSILIILQFILVSDCVTVENQCRLKISVRPRVWRFWRRHTSGQFLRGFGPFLWKKVESNPQWPYPYQRAGTSLVLTDSLGYASEGNVSLYFLGIPRK